MAKSGYYTKVQPHIVPLEEASISTSSVARKILEVRTLLSLFLNSSLAVSVHQPYKCTGRSHTTKPAGTLRIFQLFKKLWMATEKQTYHSSVSGMISTSTNSIATSTIMRRHPLPGFANFIESLHANGQHYVPIIDSSIYVSNPNNESDDHAAFENGAKLQTFIRDPTTGDFYHGNNWPGFSVLGD
jgi:hypothetical protein